ncbi:uncharacterized protein MELLADRAFT_102451 [Melampsora larici-populina 98AG31]|uniref:Uncharacterized protein n=1 Tax=Melampsora larici-populina (strain 98AG31 / pathotype 3-4-7) TaxID=747676 RepID=F4R8D0_MELLP|nr:uncharacterized protein MELLADRAFT_102451 [Melampsora larici-populina 98AG31]EGG11632.1 hypothetical protein MELLADRAFT_102451 [Melampsora larici-populina 98AG31]
MCFLISDHQWTQMRDCWPLYTGTPNRGPWSDQQCIEYNYDAAQRYYGQDSGSLAIRSFLCPYWSPGVCVPYEHCECTPNVSAKQFPTDHEAYLTEDDWYFCRLWPLHVGETCEILAQMVEPPQRPKKGGQKRKAKEN